MAVWSYLQSSQEVQQGQFCPVRNRNNIIIDGIIYIINYYVQIYKGSVYLYFQDKLSFITGYCYKRDFMVQIAYKIYTTNESHVVYELRR